MFSQLCWNLLLCQFPCFEATIRTIPYLNFAIGQSLRTDHMLVSTLRTLHILFLLPFRHQRIISPIHLDSLFPQFGHLYTITFGLTNSKSTSIGVPHLGHFIVTPSFYAFNSKLSRIILRTVFSEYPYLIAKVLMFVPSYSWTIIFWIRSGLKKRMGKLICWPLNIW